MNTFLSIGFASLGLIIGSFLNVVILRINTSKSLGGRSGCMSCQKSLNWYELIPVFSFLGLRGRCSGCKTKISIQYPLVELFVGFLFLVLFWKFKDLFYLDTVMFAVSYAYYTAVFSLLTVITVYDIRHKIIPDSLSFVFGSFAFVGMFFFDSGFFVPHLPEISYVLGSISVAVFFALLWLVSSGRWMGFGDAKLAIGLGFLIGFPAIISATFLAFWSGAIVGIFLIMLKKIKGIKSEIPFAPFLVFGTLVTFLLEVNLFNLF